MIASGYQIAQVNPSGTAAVSALAGLARKDITVTRIVVANVTGAAAAYSIYHDDDGATFSTATALFYAVSLGANSTEMIEFPLNAYGSGGIIIPRAGHLGVQTDTGSSLTFTVYGIKGLVGQG